MTDRAILVNGDGGVISPGSLSSHSVKIGPEVASAARLAAYRRGRVIEHDDTAVYAFGVGARIEFPRGPSHQDAASSATTLLKTMFRDDGADAQIAPLAIGALCFDPHQKASLLVPQLTIVSDPLRGDHAITVGRAGESTGHERLLEESHFSKDESDDEKGRAPDRFDITSRRTEDDYRRRVGAAVKAIRAGKLDKVVLARELSITANRAFRQADLLSRLRSLHPMCAVFAIDGFIGATPELLVSRQGRKIASRPLAGTVPRRRNAADDAALVAQMLASSKENSEHRFVVDDVVRTFESYATDIQAPVVPEIFQLTNVTHLATPLNATLDGESVPGAFELAVELHPTSAVAGTPRDVALQYLARHEAIDRDRYAGPVGWVDANGDGEWWIGIRSAIVNTASARLIAGAGIVADSDPDAELEETTAKFEALLAAFTSTQD